MSVIYPLKIQERLKIRVGISEIDYLAAAIVDHCYPSSVLGVEPSEGFLKTAKENFDDYGQPFLGGHGPAPAHAMSLDETARARLRDRVRERLPTEEDGSIALTARAWATHARVAA